MAKNTPFNSYNGNEPYAFVSYAHKDDDVVYEIISGLHEKRYRIWYDEGIEVGANWPRTIAEHLKDSDTVLVFVSKNSMASQNCQREINYGVSLRKNTIVIYLDDAELSEDMLMQLSVCPKIHHKSVSDTVKELSDLLEDPLIGDGVTGYERDEKKAKKKLNIWFVVALVSIALLAAMTVYVFGNMNGWFQRSGISKKTIYTDDDTEVYVTTFSDALTRDIILKSLDSPYIYICGNSVVSDASSIKRENSTFYINGETIPEGIIENLDFLKNKNVEQLAVVNQSIESIEGIGSLNNLTYLDLSGNDITDLSEINLLPGLEELHIEALPDSTDISVLSESKSLRWVYITYNMMDNIKPVVDAGIEVIIRR